MMMRSKSRTLIASAALMALVGGTVLSADKKPGGKKTAGANVDAAMVPENLALGKTATASSYQNDGLKAELAVDGNEGTRWCAENGSVPQWLAVDLGKPQDLTGCHISWEFESEKYSFKIEGSADGKAWSTFAEQAYKPGELTKFDAKGIRHIRVTANGTGPGAWASIKELEVHGTKLVAPAAQKKAGRGQPGTPTLKAPAEWDTAFFAMPPDVMYPTSVCATPTGEVYVAIDEMGSLGREKGRGRVVRVRDTKNAGKADEFLTVAKMDNPRGVWVDKNELYVLHPPFLTKYTLGANGVAEKSEELVSGITVVESLNSRGADHTTNGFRVGVDGWIYVAMGDFGATKAVGKDGTAIEMHGGGVVRLRTDGTGLEDYSFGQRNIYDVAIDPYMNCFTRDNTNDGGGWNDRLSYVVPTGNYGYPRLFVRFPGEFIDCLVDFGGGSPCGSLWVDEPQMTGLASGLLTVEWGANKVFHHPLTAKGAGYETPVKQEMFLDLQHPTDMDYDGVGHFFVTSWAGGSFAYSGDTVGYLARVSPKGLKAIAFPDVAKASDAELLGHLSSPSMKVREYAERELLRRGDKPAIADGLEKVAAGAGLMQGRVAAVFTLKLLQHEKANGALARLTKLDELREFALRALADKKNDATAPLQPFIDGTKDKNPRVRVQAAWGLARLGKLESAAALIPLAGDDDYIVQHVAVNALATLRAGDACLAAIDPSNPKLNRGLLHALQQIHDVKVVDGLAGKLKTVTDPATRTGVYAALCRLHSKEADWDGKWWGTRPDTSGPYYKSAEWEGTAKVRATLQGGLAGEPPEVIRQLVVDMQKNKIQSPEVQAFITKAAATDPAFKAMLINSLAEMTGPLNADQIAMLKAAAADEKAEPASRVKAIRALARDVKNAAALEATVEALAALIATEKPNADLASLLDETLHDAKYASQIPYFAKIAEAGTTPAKKELGYSVLLNLATSRLTKTDVKTQAGKVIERGWESPKTSVSLLRAVGRIKADGYKEMVELLATDSNADVVRAAAYATERLGMKNTGPSVESREMIEKVGYEKTIQLVLKEKGEPAKGKELFTKVGCIGCHTVSPDEPPKGPFLGGISTRYNRNDLCESIMKPSAKIAQGFETQWFKLKGNEDDPIEGFVTREGGDDLDLRNAAGVVVTVKKAEIVKRGKRDISIMPEGLVAKLSPQDLANLVSYLETLKAK